MTELNLPMISQALGGAALTPFYESVEAWLSATPLAAVLTEYSQMWPWVETLHYFGLAMLFTSVIVFDLRVLGFLKSLSITTLHKLIPIGLTGIAINIMTGSLFLTSYPDQYVQNISFQLKIICLLIAGANVITFYAFAWPKLKTSPNGTTLSWRIKVFALISLLAWTGVVIGGRLITFYRPI